MADISGKENVKELKENSPVKNWIKLISGKMALFDEYNNRKLFNHVADIVLDTEVWTSGKKEGKKKRQTVIQFNPVISQSVFSKVGEWLYLFTINGEIVKIGGTRDGLKKRGGSYLCGHHVPERGKSGDCSKTNGFIYNTFEFYLKMGCEIRMYGYKLPQTEISVDILGEKEKVSTQVFHAYEGVFLRDFKRQYKEYPALSSNSDPKYKKEK